MRFRPLLVALIALAPGAASANELLRVYELAVQNDAVLQAAASARDAAVQARPIAFGALLPQVAATGSLAEDQFTALKVASAQCTAQFQGTPSGSDCTATS